MNHIVDMNKGEFVSTSLMGYFPKPTSYQELVKVFGEPNQDSDGYKVDAEWNGKINNKSFTIYNYKTEKNYLGDQGLETEDITDWHIGGVDKQTAYDLLEYFKERRLSLC